LSGALWHIKAGRPRPLAVTGSQRSPAVPDLPTIAESGFPRFEATAWYGVLAPAGTPPAIVTRLHDEIVRALKLPDVKERLEYGGFEIVDGTPAAFGTYIKTENKKWAPVVKASGAKPE
jgi:tripartite-type tricarboxylate transporter receptor subunit TctC